MSGFLAEIGKKLAERWATLLALPGLLYLAVAVAAYNLGWAHPFDLDLLNQRLTAWAGAPSLRSIGGVVLVTIAVLIGSVAIGLASTGLGKLISYGWNLPGRRPPASWMAQWRRKRSQQAKGRADDPRAIPDQVLAAITRADRLCLIEADRPTWVGDRFRACRVRIDRTYGLDLDVIWPRLWLLIPDSVRTEIITTRDAYSASARLMGWAVLYFALVFWWWPAAVIAFVVGCGAQVKARESADILADLLEATVDIYARELANRLGQPETAMPLTIMEGRALTALTRKSRWAPDSPLAD